MWMLGSCERKGDDRIKNLQEDLQEDLPLDLNWPFTLMTTQLRLSTNDEIGTTPKVCPNSHKITIHVLHG